MGGSITEATKFCSLAPHGMSDILFTIPSGIYCQKGLKEMPLGAEFHSQEEAYVESNVFLKLKFSVIFCSDLTILKLITDSHAFTFNLFLLRGEVRKSA